MSTSTTGTCAICRQTVDVADGRVVDHRRQGTMCRGSGLAPRVATPAKRTAKRSTSSTSTPREPATPRVKKPVQAPLNLSDASSMRCPVCRELVGTSSLAGLTLLATHTVRGMQCAGGGRQVGRRTVAATCPTCGETHDAQINESGGRMTRHTAGGSPCGGSGAPLDEDELGRVYAAEAAAR
ncbi:hypothetical protein CLV49_1522 [Labedella gwakjiensis]|uniref:Uncharacterized protein n=1 Tax=Labedella gwakjiensis TaxID=390269 RepID=A0A2P8GVB9_9MICO|nr:hypothetical protein [Labedella gwakjiensis]PSL37914.1 hypothetical protein CLV49_1522 [Labedella gwakjiensis]RUQ87518.1 hypothetical protein ELQ93_11585 [Labedella gwakjiensis]